MKKIFFIGLLFFTLIMAGQACRTGQRLGHKILHTRDSISVCIIGPVYLYKNNLKTYEIPNYDSLAANVRDSLLYFNSRYLRYVNDSLFLALYFDNLTEHLKTFGIRIYSQDSMNDFLLNGGKAYMFNLAQVTLEEYLDPYTKALSSDTNDYRWEVWLNAVGLNVWYEASRLNSNGKKMNVLYANMFVRDRINGHITGNIFAGDVDFVYTLDTISLKSVYNLASRAAWTHAQYIFDYILNDQMDQKSAEGKPRREYMHYDPEKGNLRKAGTHKFTLMK